MCIVLKQFQRPSRSFFFFCFHHHRRLACIFSMSLLIESHLWLSLFFFVTHVKLLIGKVRNHRSIDAQTTILTMGLHRPDA